MPSREALERRLGDALFSKPLVGNAIRGLLVEAIISFALEPNWTWMADGWGEVDFRGPGGVGLEVKQGAALQNWHEPGAKASQPRFDIAMRKNHVLRDGTVVQQRGRSAEIYVFAWHPVTDPAVCDHRDPAQWEFYVVRADALPDQKSIGLAGVRGLIQKVSVNRILAATNYTLTQLAR